MMTPKTISGWCMWLFFLVFGLASLLGWFGVTFLEGHVASVLEGIFALGYAIFALMGR
jgi:hypothetical protein